MSYLSLTEAAKYIRNQTGIEMDAASLLRAGTCGAILITATFSGLMRNLADHQSDDYTGLLVIPSRHLLEIQADGKAQIIGAFSLDGKITYSPQVVITFDQLLVLVSELDRVIPNIVEIKPKKKAAPDEAPEGDDIETTGMVAWQAAILENWVKATEKRGNAITARQVMSWCKLSGPRDVFPRDQPNNKNSMQWKDFEGNPHTVTLLRIGTVLSEWRKAGTIPPRK